MRTLPCRQSRWGGVVGGDESAAHAANRRGPRKTRRRGQRQRGVHLDPDHQARSGGRGVEHGAVAAAEVHEPLGGPQAESDRERRGAHPAERRMRRRRKPVASRRAQRTRRRAAGSAATSRSDTAGDVKHAGTIQDAGRWPAPSAGGAALSPGFRSDFLFRNPFVPACRHLSMADRKPLVRTFAWVSQ